MSLVEENHVDEKKMVIKRMCIIIKQRITNYVIFMKMKQKVNKSKK